MIINNYEMKSKKILYHYIKNNDINILFDNNDELNKWFSLDFTGVDKKIMFLKYLKNIKPDRRKAMLLFFNSNSFTSEKDFPKERFVSYMSYIDQKPKDKASKKYFQLRYGDNYLIKYKNNKDKQKKLKIIILKNMVKVRVKKGGIHI
jgi:hypothetical protein